jgi:hypothetical protein
MAFIPISAYQARSSTEPLSFVGIEYVGQALRDDYLQASQHYGLIILEVEGPGANTLRQVRLILVTIHAINDDVRH